MKTLIMIVVVGTVVGLSALAATAAVLTQTTGSLVPAQIAQPTINVNQLQPTVNVEYLQPTVGSNALQPAVGAPRSIN